MSNYDLRPKSTSKNADDIADEEAVIEKEPRSKNWSWEDSYELLRIAAKEGKNWAKILQILHSRHICTDITDHAKLRARYHTLNGKASFLRKPYTAPKFQVPAKNCSPEEKRKKEEEHAAKHELIRKEHEAALLLIAEIEAREELATTNEAPPTEEEIKTKMVEKAEDRRVVRNERFKTFEDAAKEEKEFRNGLVTTMRELFELYRESVKQDRELISALLHQAKKPKYNNNNLED